MTSWIKILTRCKIHFFSHKMHIYYNFSLRITLKVLLISKHIIDEKRLRIKFYAWNHKQIYLIYKNKILRTTRKLIRVSQTTKIHGTILNVKNECREDIKCRHCRSLHFWKKVPTIQGPFIQKTFQGNRKKLSRKSVASMGKCQIE